MRQLSQTRQNRFPGSRSDQKRDLRLGIPESTIHALARLSAIVAILLLGCLHASAQMDDIWRAGGRGNVVATEHHDVWATGAVVAVLGTVNHELTARVFRMAVSQV
jgi:hypothetical protein